jgi:histidine decarboxylase
MPDSVSATLSAVDVESLTARWDAARRLNIGFPGATDFDYTDLGPVLGGQLLNNVGDPFVDGAAANQTKLAERQVVGFLADLFRSSGERVWGYVTAGGSEGNLYGLWVARSLFPDAVVYHSDAAHSSVDKAVSLLGMASVRIRTDRWGQLDYGDLTTQMRHRRDRAAVVVASIGTTMTEAVDDLRVIGGVLDELAIRRRFLHADAALSGVPLALMDPVQRPGFDFADGADCVTISGHKFLGMPMPCGVVLIRRELRDRVTQPGRYTGSPDATITGSRNGHTPLMLWHRLSTLGIDGLRERAGTSRKLAAYTHNRLVDIGWPAHRFDHAFTVALRTPPDAVSARWVLASTGGWSHVITMPGMTADQVDAFLSDLEAALAQPAASVAVEAGVTSPTAPEDVVPVVAATQTGAVSNGTGAAVLVPRQVSRVG